MFTGIIETIGAITAIEQEGTNLHFTIQSSISSALKIDQSVAHNGVCLTVVALHGDTHTVTAIAETLDKTSLAAWRIGDTVNLERAMLVGARMDGHAVQGHVDTVGKCVALSDKNGSWSYTFEYPAAYRKLLVDKGSICVDGVSLTVVSPNDAQFSVAIIPYTYANTTFQNYTIGQTINLEFDITGKYIARYMELYGLGQA